MPRIQIHYQKVRDADQVLKRASQELKGIAAQLQGIQSSLEFDVLARRRNREGFLEAIRGAQRAAQRTEALLQTVESGLEQYRWTESKLSGGAAKLEL